MTVTGERSTSQFYWVTLSKWNNERKRINIFFKVEKRRDKDK